MRVNHGCRRLRRVCHQCVWPRLLWAHSTAMGTVCVSVSANGRCLLRSSLPRADQQVQPLHGGVAVSVAVLLNVSRRAAAPT